MPDLKISQLPSKGTLIGTEEIAIADAGVSKKVTFDNLIGSAKIPRTRAVTIENPSGAEDLSLFFTDVPITITRMLAVVVGSTPSVTFTIRHGADRSAAGAEVVTGGSVCTNTTTGLDITSFDDATIVAESHVWIETTATGGTVDSFTVTLFYDED